MSRSRQLAAIMFTDIVGYTALMGKNEQKALASFDTVSDAVFAAFEIQEGCKKEVLLQLRIGIHLKDVMTRIGYPD